MSVQLPDRDVALLVRRTHVNDLDQWAERYRCPYKSRREIVAYLLQSLLDRFLLDDFNG